MTGAPPLPPNAARLATTPQLHSLLTIIRDKTTPRSDFIFYSDRIIRLLVEEGQPYTGVEFQGRICGVSILRAGEAMESGLRECCRSVRIGKILAYVHTLTQNEETGKPKLFYAKLPEDIGDRWVLLLDPMLAIQAIKVLLDHGVKPERIIFLNMIASPEGLRSIWDAFPQVRVISAWVDTKLSEQNYSRSHRAHIPVLPGLGDYGDRYYSG